MGYMRDKIGTAAMYEQLAEESAELCKAALKMARIIRGENPTPVTSRQAAGDLLEEYTDVIICANEIGLLYNEGLAAYKQKRFKQRWEESHAAKSVKEIAGARQVRELERPERETKDREYRQADAGQDREKRIPGRQTVHRLCEQVRDVIDFEWKRKAYVLKIDNKGKVSAEEAQRVVQELYAMHRESVIKVLERYEDDAEYD